MKVPFPVLTGLITRRVLINYRLSPDIAAQQLPPPFRPRLVAGWAIAGVCLIRLHQVRPAFLPPVIGLTSENAAHRIAVEWDHGPTVQTGVYIPRRDTDSCCNQLLGGRLFPGVHHIARFSCAETEHRLKIEMRSVDAQTFVRVAARVEPQWRGTSVFPSLTAASDFFRTGGPGWSLSQDRTDLEGLELRPKTWNMQSLTVECLESNYFSNPTFFPPEKIQFDCALLMREVPHEWQALGNFANQHPQTPVNRNRHGTHALFEMP